MNLSGGTSFATFVGGIMGIINSFVIPVIFALIFLAFMWGVVKYYFLHGDDERSRQSGHQFIVWGILGIVILFSIWGLVNVLLSTLGINP